MRVAMIVAFAADGNTSNNFLTLKHDVIVYFLLALIQLFNKKGHSQSRVPLWLQINIPGNQLPPLSFPLAWSCNHQGRMELS